MSNRAKAAIATFFLIFAGACSAERAEALGEVEQTVAVPSETALYAGVCGFDLASFDPKYAIRFYAETTFTPSSGLSSSDRADGELALALTPLFGWNVRQGVPQLPASVSLSETRGDRITATSAVSGGSFEASYAGLDLSPDANSILGTVARVDRLKLTGRFGGGDRFCAGFSGMLTVPVEYEFVPEENVCVFLKVRKGDSLPNVTSKDFHCP
jgi:hypothetical protein